MKTMKKIGITMGIMGLAGYGMWTLYKKYNPECLEDMEDVIKKMGREVEDKIEDIA